MDVTVGTAPVELSIPGASCPVLQNLGPGAVYVDTNANVSAASGVKLAVNEKLALTRPVEDLEGPLYAIADAAGTDLRIAAL